MENLLKVKKRMIKNHSDDFGNDIPTAEFQISAAAAQGGRKYMEDRISIEVGRTNGQLQYLFAAIYDGHGGPQASEFASQNLLENIIGNQAFFSEDDQQVLSAIRDGFLQTHRDMQKVAIMWPRTVSGFPCTAGTTASCAFIRNGKLYTGHVGDSSIILANFEEAASGFNDAKLTEDHKPEKHSERQRIEKAGGAVASKTGIIRVVWKRPIHGHRGPVRRSTSTENIPFLAVARSLGDFWSLNTETNQFVVSPEPDVDVFRLKSSDNFIVLCSDGLSNVVGFRSIVQILHELENQNGKSLMENNSYTKQSHLINHSHHLLQFALKKWGGLRADNISIVCIKLNADKMPSDHLNVVEIGKDIDVCKQLTEYPYAMLHITSENTFRLRGDVIPHFFNGIYDKGVNCGKKSNQAYFTGPGFITPEFTNNSSTDKAIETLSGSSICGCETGQKDHENDYGESSDVEENKKHISDDNKNVDEDSLKDMVNLSKSIPKMPTSRSGIKRRRTENGGSDECIRNTSDLSFPSSSSKKKVYFEEQDEIEETMNPPPAKRSRLQSFFNFFSKFLNW